ncbi:MAG: hypothetical protein ACRDYY_01855 [Acidimicrobiales bacterium]
MFGVLVSFFVLPLFGIHAWLLMGDQGWMSACAQWVANGAMGNIYQGPFGYLTLPGFLFLSAPIALVGTHLGLVTNYPASLPHPSMWLLMGPFDLVCGAASLLGVDYLAKTVGVVGVRRKILLPALGILFVVPTVVFPGHPEDLLALGLAATALAKSLRGRTAWVGFLMAAAMLMQMWAILALPVVIASLSSGRRVRAFLHAVVPPGALGATLLILDWSHASFALLTQPSFAKGQELVWWGLSPKVHLVLDGTSFTGRVGSDSRWMAVAVAVVAAVYVWRRFSPVGAVGAMGVALLARSVFEVEIWPFYVAPGLVLILVVALLRCPPKRMATAAAFCFAAYACSSGGYAGFDYAALLATGLLYVSIAGAIVAAFGTAKSASDGSDNPSGNRLLFPRYSPAGERLAARLGARL